MLVHSQKLKGSVAHSPAFGGAGGRRRRTQAGALSGRLLVALATCRLVISLEGVTRNFPWVSRYFLVACDTSVRAHKHTSVLHVHAVHNNVFAVVTGRVMLQGIWACMTHGVAVSRSFA